MEKMNKSNLLKKVNALAEFGVGGEKENAQKKLKELKKKYAITETELKTGIKEPERTIPKEYVFNLADELGNKFKIKF